MITRYRVVVSLLLAIAAAAMYVAFLSAKEPEPTISNAQGVLEFQPAANSISLRQARIFAKLQEGYVGSLIVEGIEIPEAELDHLEGSNWVGFTPGPGTATGALKPGRRCTTVAFWKPEAGRTTAESFQWCWQVH